MLSINAMDQPWISHQSGSVKKEETNTNTVNDRTSISRCPWDQRTLILTLVTYLEGETSKVNKYVFEC